MTTNNALINWLVENVQRLFMKSPKFFKVWKIILSVPVLIIALPNALKLFNIHLPQVFNDKITIAVSWASTAALIFSFFPTQSIPVATDQNGTPIKQTDTIKLPFTAQAEEKQMQKQIDNPDIMVTQIKIPNPVKPL